MVPAFADHLLLLAVCTIFGFLIDNFPLRIVLRVTICFCKLDKCMAVFFLLELCTHLLQWQLLCYLGKCIAGFPRIVYRPSPIAVPILADFLEFCTLS